MRFSYLTKEYHWSERMSDEELNELGEQGWELVNFVVDSQFMFHYVFKRVEGKHGL